MDAGINWYSYVIWWLISDYFLYLLTEALKNLYANHIMSWVSWKLLFGSQIEWSNDLYWLLDPYVIKHISSISRGMKTHWYFIFNWVEHSIHAHGDL